MTKLVCTSEVSIGSFACGLPEEYKYARKSLCTRIESNAVERGNEVKEVKWLCKEFGFTAGLLRGSIAEGRKKL